MLGQEWHMPALENARHERFAQELAKGKTADEAYRNAGYKANRGNAATLKANQSVLDRVAELQERGAIRTEITIDSITQMLLEDRKLARELGQAAAAVSASEKLGKLHGHFVDRSENVNIDYQVGDEPSDTNADEWLGEHRPN